MIIILVMITYSYGNKTLFFISLSDFLVLENIHNLKKPTTQFKSLCLYPFPRYVIYQRPSPWSVLQAVLIIFLTFVINHFPRHICHQRRKKSHSVFLFLFSFSCSILRLKTYLNEELVQIFHEI